MAAMKLYMTPGSCSTGIHIILEELDEIFEAYVVNLPAGDHFKADYVAINPKSTIPTLVRGDGTALTEVPAIAYWLARTHPRARLWPEDVESETRALEAMAYIVGTIHGQGFARIFATPTFARNPADHDAVRQLGRDIVEKGFAILDAALARITSPACFRWPIRFYFMLRSGQTRRTFRCPNTSPRTIGACWRAPRSSGCCARRATIPRPWVCPWSPLE